MPEWLIRDSRQPEMVLHPSTGAALLALKAIHDSPQPAGRQEAGIRRMLDIGCGSGLLSMVAAQLWPECRIVASDISQQAVDDASLNMRQHGLETRVTVLRADAYDHPAIHAGAPYDLIACNLLAELLIKTSPDLLSHLQPGGYAVLSGILAWMYPQVMEAHTALGLEIAGEIEMKEWRAMVVKKSSVVS